ncbi:MAG: 3D domain-containing protein [Anaerolineae bacterium]
MSSSPGTFPDFTRRATSCRAAVVVVLAALLWTVAVPLLAHHTEQPGYRISAPAAHEHRLERLPSRGRSNRVTGEWVTMTVTAYTAGPESTGKTPGHPAYGITKSGEPAGPGTIAADPSIPFGTRIWVPGYGWGIVKDRGSAIKGNRLDVFVPDVREAVEWGRRELAVLIVREGG